MFSLAGGVAQDIFQGGALVGGYRLNKARYDELLSDYHKSVISAFSNVEDALVASQQTAEQYRRQQDAVAKARRAYEITRDPAPCRHSQRAHGVEYPDRAVQCRGCAGSSQVCAPAGAGATVQALGGGWQQTAAQS